MSVLSPNLILSRKATFIDAVSARDFYAIEWHDWNEHDCIITKSRKHPGKFLYREFPELYHYEDPVQISVFGPENLAEYAEKYALSMPEGGHAVFYGED